MRFGWVARVCQILSFAQYLTARAGRRHQSPRASGRLRATHPRHLPPLPPQRSSPAHRYHPQASARSLRFPHQPLLQLLLPRLSLRVFPLCLFLLPLLLRSSHQLPHQLLHPDHQQLRMPPFQRLWMRLRFSLHS